MSPETEYNDLMDEKIRLGKFIAVVENEISRFEVEIEVGKLRISEAEDRITEIDVRLAEIQGT